MSTKPGSDVVQFVSEPPRRKRQKAVADGPGEVDGQVRRSYKKPYKGQGTKLQTQVPKEWRQRVVALAREHGVRESDVVRTLLERALNDLAGEI